MQFASEGGPILFILPLWLALGSRLLETGLVSKTFFVLGGAYLGSLLWSTVRAIATPTETSATPSMTTGAQKWMSP